MGWGLAKAAGIGAVGSIAGAMLGNKAAQKASNASMAQAYALRQQGLGELEGMDPLSLPDFMYSPEELQYLQGSDPLSYTQPEQYQAQDVQIDPGTRDAQMSALQEMQQRGDEGLSAADNYNFMKNRRNTETAARGQEQAIMENMKARGMGGTGVEAAMRMQASQGGSDRLSEQQALQAMANAQMRMGATQNMGQMAGQIRGQDTEQSQTNAEILNDMAWKNSERNRQIQNMNTDLKNRASQANTAEQRNIQASNIAERNKANVMNQTAAIDKSRDEQMNKQGIAQAKSNALTGGLSDIYAAGAANAANARGKWDTIGAAFPAAANIYMAGQQQESKERIAAADRAQSAQNNAALYNNARPKRPTSNNPYARG